MSHPAGFRHPVLAALALSLLAACSSPEPYYLGRITPGVTGYDTNSAVPLKDPKTGLPYFSICYNRLLHDAADIRRLVREHCSDPQLVRNQPDLYACSLGAPVQATYLCSSLSRAAAEARPNLQQSGTYTGTINLY
ncbi:hypothetical protein [Ferrovibrio sp.]|uniref:hypothetical protein n=1 Tax=Ferrovibrio sp. TaxID=1917215 RepID=UPI00312048E7